MPTRQQMIDKHGSEEAFKAHMSNLGKSGGKAPHKRPRWFAENPELAAIAGVKSGRVKRARKLDK